MQDCYFYDHSDIDKHVIIGPLPEVASRNGLYLPPINVELLQSVDSEAMYNNIAGILKKIYHLGKNRPILIIEGYRIFDDPRIRKRVDLPIFIHLENNLIRIRRYAQSDRDDEYMQTCILPCYLQYRMRCAEFMTNLIEINGIIPFEKICDKVKALLVREARITYRLMDFRPKLRHSVNYVALESMIPD